MLVSKLTGCGVTEEIAERILFEGLEYTGEDADLIMVLGSSKAPEYRVPPAVKLLKKGKADKLLLCGGKCQQTAFGYMPEYKAMEKSAKALGADTLNILTETKSYSTAENFKCSAEIIKEKFPDCRKIILVTIAYHMRRSIMLAGKILPQYKFIPYPVNAGSAAREVWKSSQKGRKTVIDECLKIGYYIRIGSIDDFEI